MKKSKIATLFICIALLIYAIIANTILITKINRIYLYIINPIFWILIVVLLRAEIGDVYFKKQREKECIKYALIAVLTYIIIYLLSGLFLTFGYNPYLNTLKGLIWNIWILGIPLILREYIRFLLIQNVYEKDRVKFAILISAIYIFIDMDILLITRHTLTPLYITKTFSQTILPLICENILFSYNAMYTGWLPNICYKFLINMYIWLSPILPKSPWIMNAIIDSIIPVILMLYIRFEKNKSDFYKSRDNIRNSDPRSIIPLIVLIIFGIWFAIGIFPIKPISIASGSMEKELFVGDLAIIKKCKANDVTEGDIIEYQMEGYTVIHRIINKQQRNGEFFFTTKGDNNKGPDALEVTEDQLIGKVIFKVRYLGYPAIWLHLIQEEEEIAVETGK